MFGDVNSRRDLAFHNKLACGQRDRGSQLSKHDRCACATAVGVIVQISRSGVVNNPIRRVRPRRCARCGEEPIGIQRRIGDCQCGEHGLAEHEGVLTEREIY